VDEEQVENLQSQRSHRGVEAAQRVVAPMVGIVELGGDEQVPARQTAGGDRSPHPGLVAIHLGGVDVPVTHCQGIADHALGLVVGDLVGTESQLGDEHLLPVGSASQGDGGNG
jgi:hypothetical protein